MTHGLILTHFLTKLGCMRLSPVCTVSACQSSSKERRGGELSHFKGWNRESSAAVVAATHWRVFLRFQTLLTKNHQQVIFTTKIVLNCVQQQKIVQKGLFWVPFNDIFLILDGPFGTKSGIGFGLVWGRRREGSRLIVDLHPVPVVSNV